MLYFLKLHPGCIRDNNVGGPQTKFPTGVLSAGIKSVGTILHNLILYVQEKVAHFI